jgi:hypothetical protein
VRVSSRNIVLLRLTFGLPLVLTAALVSPHLIARAKEDAAPAPIPAPEQVQFFEKNIRPVLADHCYSCHSADGGSAGGLRVDSRDLLLKGGKSGPAIIAGDPDNSLLIQRLLLADPKHRMPKDEDDPLAAAAVANLKLWIQQGAYWPTDAQEPPAPKDGGTASAKGTPTAAEFAYFKNDVRPIFVAHCYNCHSQDFKEAGGLRVDTHDGFFAGGKSGPVVIPGHPEQSLLIKKLLLNDPKHRMPQSAPPLSTDEIAILTKWVGDGAAWPDETEKLPPVSASLQKTYTNLRAHHWAFQPLTNPKVPVVANSSWPTNNIDRFVLAKLDQEKMTPVADADPATLIRRVTYDLTGLPPTPAAVKAFRKHHSQHDYEQLVDNLLQSPQYGERWGRHWLDVARYGESSGPSRNMPYPHAWRYRDYVIDSYNRDVPYNRFLREQIAGDLLHASTPTERDRLNIATGFLALGPKDVNQRFHARFVMDNVDDQIDTVTRSSLALTVGCARCHDHKFDPIPTSDYYALAGIFTSTQDGIGLNSHMGGASLSYYDPKLLGYLNTSEKAPLIPADELAKLKEKKEEAESIKKEYDAILDTPKGRELGPDGRLYEQVLLKKYQHLNEEAVLPTDLGYRGYGVHVVREGKVGNTWVRIRGVEERHGPKVPRGFLTAFKVPGVPAVDPHQSGRLQLAEWLTSSNNPLTPRVYSNRIWEHLFGEGIVTTVDNFGITGDQPSNPQLLDYLSQQLIQNGWSTKKLIRTIVLSRTYRLSSDAPAAYLDKDPADRLLWRHAPRRMETEEIRDSILASSGKLQLAPPTGSPAMALPMIEIAGNGPQAHALIEAANHSSYRSVYLPLLRGVTPPTLAAFDPVTQTLVTGQRDATTVPTQALYMLNSSFVRLQSQALADKLLAERTGLGSGTKKRLDLAYQLVLCRQPSKAEQERDLKFLAHYQSLYSKTPQQTHSPQPAKEVSSIDNDGVIHIEGQVAEDPVDLKDPPEAAWAALVQSMYASAEFVFIR